MNFIIWILMYSTVLYAYYGEALSLTKQEINWQNGNDTIESHQPSISISRPILQPEKKVYKIVTVAVEPFVMLKRAAEMSGSDLVGNDIYEGYCIDMMTEIAKYLKENNHFEEFEYELYLSRENKYGRRQANGSWDGMIGDLLNNEADVALAPLTINKEREQVVEFSNPFMTTGISVMIKKPTKDEREKLSLFWSTQPLGMNIWMFILCSYVSVAILLFLVSRISQYKWRKEVSSEDQGSTIISNSCNCLWLTLVAFTRLGNDVQPRLLSGRVASNAWWLFTIIIVSSYTANLAVIPFFSLEKIPRRIESVDDLAAKQYEMDYGIQQGGSTESFFAESAVPMYQKMYQYMTERYERQKADHLARTGSMEGKWTTGVMVKSYAEGIERVRSSQGQYAFLLEETANDYVNMRKPCDTMKVGGNLNMVYYGIATKKGSELSLAINLAVLHLQETGKLNKLKTKWWYDRGQCSSPDQSVLSLREYAESFYSTLNKVVGATYILVACFGFWLVTAFTEYIFHARQRNMQEKSQEIELEANGIKTPLRLTERNENESNNIIN